MKIMHIISSLGYGGVEISLLRLIENNREDEHFVVCLSQGGPIREKLEELGVIVFALNLKYFNLPLKVWVVNSVCKSEDIKIVTSWLYHADFFSGCLKIINHNLKILWTVHNSLVDRNSMKASTAFLIKINSALSYIIPNKIIYCAHSARVEHEGVHRYNRKNGAVVYNGALPDYNEKQNIGRRFNISAPIIGMSARWDPIKNHRLALATISNLVHSEKYNNLSFILCGQNIDYKNISLCNLISEFSLEKNVKLLGSVQNMAEFYNQIDVLLITSFSEALPNVAIEAMYSTKPVVSTDVGDLRQVVGKCGQISDNNSIDMASNVVNVFEHYDDYVAELSESDFLSFMSQFKIETVVNIYRNIWNEL